MLYSVGTYLVQELMWFSHYSLSLNLYIIQFYVSTAECNNELRVIKTLTDMGLLLALKYGVPQPELKDELDEIDHNKLHCNEYKLNKLHSDRLVYFYYDNIIPIFKSF